MPIDGTRFFMLAGKSFCIDDARCVGRVGDARILSGTKEERAARQAKETDIKCRANRRRTPDKDRVSGGATDEKDALGPMSEFNSDAMNGDGTAEPCRIVSDLTDAASVVSDCCIQSRLKE